LLPPLAHHLAEDESLSNRGQRLQSTGRIRTAVH
jgi:hypothetical protein